MMRTSVVIPSYNHASFVCEAVESALAAPVAELEVVVVDDGSSDDSLARLSVFAGDARVRVLAQENRGAHAALNRGLEAATGELIFILNSDDLFTADRIPRLGELLLADRSIAVAASWLRVVDAGGGNLGVKQGYHNMPPWPRPRRGPGLADTGDLHLALLETNFVATSSNFAFRRQLVDDGLRFRPLRFAHDWAFLLEALERGRLELVGDPLLSYRVHGANTIREGERQDAGQGLMRFEILWVVARHAAGVLRRSVEHGSDADDLRRRLWTSLPRFGCDALLHQLLALRGTDEQPPAAYDALLASDHPLRRAAITVLEHGGD